jgi:hypothetical protein
MCEGETPPRAPPAHRARCFRCTSANEGTSTRHRRTEQRWNSSPRTGRDAFACSVKAQHTIYKSGRTETKKCSPLPLGTHQAATMSSTARAPARQGKAQYHHEPLQRKHCRARSSQECHRQKWQAGGDASHMLPRPPSPSACAGPAAGASRGAPRGRRKRRPRAATARRREWRGATDAHPPQMADQGPGRPENGGGRRTDRSGVGRQRRKTPAAAAAIPWRPQAPQWGTSRAARGRRRKRRRRAPTARRREWRRATAARRNPAAEQAPDHLERPTMEVGLLHASAGMPQAEPQGACPHGPDGPGSAPTSAGSAHNRRKGRRRPATGD